MDPPNVLREDEPENELVRNISQLTINNSTSTKKLTDSTSEQLNYSKNNDLSKLPHYYSSAKLLERLSNYENCKNFDNRRQIYSNILLGRRQIEDNSLAWQDKYITQQSKLLYLYETQHNSDVTFEVENTTITAHKFILSVCSPVFEAMFSNNWCTSDVIKIDDIDIIGFKIMLKFAYTDIADLSEDTVMEVLYIAKKYQIISLEYLCVEYLGENLLPSNACILLDQATKFNIKLLADMCFNIIDQNTDLVLKSEGFNEVSKESLYSIVTRGTLKIDELTLFQYVILWGKKQAEKANIKPTPENLREILGDIIKEIRYPLMTVEDFANVVVPTEILKSEQMVELYTYYALKDSNNPPEISFCSECRVVTEEFIINRFQRIESRWGYNGTPDRVKFQVDYPVFLKGFGLYGSMNVPNTYKVIIEIIKASDGISVAKTETEMITSGKSETFRVYLNEPVEIEPNIVYIASVTLNGRDSFYGSKGLRQIIKQTSHRPITIRFTYAAGNNNGTSVDDGQIPEFIFYIKR